MTEFSPDRCAALLLGARRAPGPLRRKLAALPDGAHPTTLAEGVAAQTALARLKDRSVPAGFKIGATAARMQAHLGLDGPAAGFMPRENLHGSGSTLSFNGFLHPGVECELAVHLGADLPGACTPDKAAAAVDLVMAGIEVVENRYDDLQSFGAPALVADQVFHAAAVLGEPFADWRSLDLGALEGTLSLNGKRVAGGQGRELLGHPMAALAWLAGSAEARAFGGLKAGQVVMLGSVCPPVWLDGPAEVSVAFAPLPAVMLSLVAS